MLLYFYQAKVAAAPALLKHLLTKPAQIAPHFEFFDLADEEQVNDNVLLLSLVLLLQKQIGMGLGQPQW